MNEETHIVKFKLIAIGIDYEHYQSSVNGLFYSIIVVDVISRYLHFNQSCILMTNFYNLDDVGDIENEKYHILVDGLKTTGFRNLDLKSIKQCLAITSNVPYHKMYDLCISLLTKRFYVCKTDKVLYKILENEEL